MSRALSREEGLRLLRAGVQEYAALTEPTWQALAEITVLDLVLQASAAGAPLYRSMGFETQFPVPHLRVAVPAPSHGRGHAPK